MKLVLGCLTGCVLLTLCDSEVCLPQWSSIEGSSETDNHVPDATQLQHCMAACERDLTCVAIDFDERYAKQPSCWFSSAQQIVQKFSSTNKIPNRTHYRISRHCQTFMGEENPVNWTLHFNTSSDNGEQVNYWTEYDCFTLCRYNSSCVAVDFDAKTTPPCWIHTDPKDLNLKNIFVSKDVVQYRFNRSSNLSSSVKKVERCVGQWFLNDSWCPSDSLIQIRSVYFKDNPLCTYRNSDDAHPPDAEWLQQVDVQYLDPSYYNQTQSCNGKYDCFLRAKCPVSESYAEPCDIFIISNIFVAISYTCLFNGTSTLSVSSSLATTSSLSSSLAEIGEMHVNSDKNRNIIIGVVVGLGVPLILLIVALIVYAVMKAKKTQKEKLTTNDDNVACYYYENSTMKYDSSTTPRGANPDNAVNEISVEVDQI